MGGFPGTIMRMEKLKHTLTSFGWGGRSRSWGAVQLGAGLQVPADEEGKEGVTQK